MCLLNTFLGVGGGGGRSYTLFLVDFVEHEDNSEATGPEA